MGIIKYIIGLAIAASLVHLILLQPTHVEPSAAAPVDRLPSAVVAINDFRASRHLPPVALDSQLDQSAQLKANDMVSKNYWSHIAPNGTTPWYFFKEAGYKYSEAGENLAKCFETGQAVVQAWIDSPEHRAVLMDGYTDIGIGVAHNTHDNCDYVVAHFGTR